MITDMLSNKKLNLIVTELFLKGKKPNISLVFITQSYFTVPKSVRQNSTHYFIIKFQTNKKFNKLHLIIHQISTVKVLWIFTKIYWKIMFFFSYWFYVLEKEYFRKNLFQTTIGDKVRDEKLKCNIDRETAQISALSTLKINNYEYLRGEEILPADQSRIKEQAKFTYCFLGKTLGKQIKTIQVKKQIKPIKSRVEKITLRHGSKINCRFVFKRFFIWKN